MTKNKKNSKEKSKDNALVKSTSNPEIQQNQLLLLILGVLQKFLPTQKSPLKMLNFEKIKNLLKIDKIVCVKFLVKK